MPWAVSSLKIHFADNPVDILSRVAEGLGPTKPQQPAAFRGGAGATSYPAKAGRDKIVCPTRLFFSSFRFATPRRAEIPWTINTVVNPNAQAAAPSLALWW